MHNKPTTHVLLMTVPRKIRWRLAFGRRRLAYPVDATGRDLEVLKFEAGELFGLSRQKLNDYGVTHSEFLVLQACEPGGACHRIEGVSPGARILFQVSSKAAYDVAVQVFQQMVEVFGPDLDIHQAFIETLAVPIRARIFPRQLLNNYFASSAETVAV